MSSTTNIPTNARTMSGTILISDGVAVLENGSLTNVSNINTDTISTTSFSSNDFQVATNIDLTSNTSKLQFLYGLDPSNTLITRSQINVTNLNATNIISTTQLASDNSTKVATTAYVKNQNYATTTTTNNTFSNSNTFNGRVDVSSAFYIGGVQYTAGNQGNQGFTGTQGSQGVTGSQGYQGNQGVIGLTGDKYQTTSSNTINLSTLVVGNSYTYTIGTSLSYTAGQSIIFANSSTQQFISLVNTYNSGTGSINLTVNTVIGTSSFSSWQVNLNGAQGLQGNQGNQGYQGYQGSTGIQGPQGYQGNNGINGTNGTNGITGSQGYQGYQGNNGVTGDKYQTTSSNTINLSTLVVGNSYTYTIGTSLSYTAGQNVIFAISEFQQFTSFVNSYNSGTGSIIVIINYIIGSNTYSSWQVNLNGTQGIQGPQGYQGYQGNNGTNGTNGITGSQGYQGAQGSGIYPEILVTTTNANFYPTFSSATSGNQQMYVDTLLTYNPSTDVLAVGNIQTTGNANFIKNVNSYPPSWSKTNYIAYHSQSFGLNNITNLTGIATHNDNIVAGYNNGNAITSTTFDNNSIYGASNLTDTATYTVQNSTILGKGNINTSNTGTLTSLSASTIIGNDNFSTASGININAGAVAGLVIVGNTNGLNSSGQIVSGVTLVGTQLATVGQTYNSTAIGIQSGIGGNRSTVIGYSCQSIGNDCILIGNNLTFTGNSTINIGGTDGSGNPMNVMFSGVLKLSSGIQFNNLDLQLTGGITLTSAYFGTPINFLSTSTNTFTINLPSPIYAGATLEINNNSNFYQILASSVSIFGRYGNGGLTINIQSGQSYGLICNGTNWSVYKVWGVPYQYIRYHNTTQSGISTSNVAGLFNSVGANIDSATTAWAVDTWNGAKLSYNTSTGVFTNNTGYTMTLQVDGKIFSATNVVRYAGIRLDATRYNDNNSPNWFTLPIGSTSTLPISRTFTLKNTEAFAIVYQASASAVFGSTTSMSMNRIIITRLG